MKRKCVWIRADDEVVQKFLKGQANKSMSLRLLIKNHVREHGFGDVTCMDLEGLLEKPDGVPVLKRRKVKTETKPVPSVTEAEPLKETSSVQVVPTDTESVQTGTEPVRSEPVEPVEVKPQTVQVQPSMEQMVGGAETVEEVDPAKMLGF